MKKFNVECKSGNSRYLKDSSVLYMRVDLGKDDRGNPIELYAETNKRGGDLVAFDDLKRNILGQAFLLDVCPDILHFQYDD